jgi:hypothetical protein
MNHISRGAPAKYAHFPNIQKIGHSDRVSCGTCAFYDRSDRSCKKQPVFVPEIGYNYWKYCKHFQLDREYASQGNLAFVERNWMCAKKKKKMNNTKNEESPKEAAPQKRKEPSKKSEWLDRKISVYDYEDKETYSYKVVQSPNSNLEKHQISKDSVLFQEADKVSPGTDFKVNGFRYKLISKKTC